MSEWPTIDTAPKVRDLYVLLWAKGYPRPAIGRWCGPQLVDDVFEWCTEDGAMMAPPSHWMPLPSPPSPVTDATAIIQNAIGNNPSIGEEAEPKHLADMYGAFESKTDE